jgi:DNA-directed RNA polymerase specialized sigma24 family protein
MLKRTRQSKLTPKQRYEVATRYRDGEDPKELALEYGISAGWVRSLGSR